MCQTATYFRNVNGFMVPCKAGDRGAKKMSMMDLQPETLKCPDVAVEHFVGILERGGGATVAKEELTQFEDWTKEFGQEGA